MVPSIAALEALFRVALASCSPRSPPLPTRPVRQGRLRVVRRLRYALVVAAVVIVLAPGRVFVGVARQYLRDHV